MAPLNLSPDSAFVTGCILGSVSAGLESYPGAVVAVVLFVLAYLTRRDDRAIETRDRIHGGALTRLETLERNTEDLTKTIAETKRVADDVATRLNLITRHR